MSNVYHGPFWGYGQEPPPAGGGALGAPGGGLAQDGIGPWFCGGGGFCPGGGFCRGGGFCGAGLCPGRRTSGLGGLGAILLASMYCTTWSGISARTSLARAACEIWALPPYCPPMKSRKGTNWQKNINTLLINTTCTQRMTKSFYKWQLQFVYKGMDSKHHFDFPTNKICLKCVCLFYLHNISSSIFSIWTQSLFIRI